MRVSWTMVFLSTIFSVEGVVSVDMTIFSSDSDSVNPRAPLDYL